MRTFLYTKPPKEIQMNQFIEEQLRLTPVKRCIVVLRHISLAIYLFFCDNILRCVIVHLYTYFSKRWLFI
jgi:hypothetical protein